MRANLAAVDGGQILPDLVGGEAKYGRNQANEGFCDLPQNRLRRAAGMARGRECVHAIFECIEIERAQVDNSEFIDCLIDAMEFKGRVPVEDLFGKIASAGQHVAIERQKILLKNGIARWIESV